MLGEVEVLPAVLKQFPSCRKGQSLRDKAGPVGVTTLGNLVSEKKAAEYLSGSTSRVTPAGLLSILEISCVTPVLLLPDTAISWLSMDENQTLRKGVVTSPLAVQ